MKKTLLIFGGTIAFIFYVLPLLAQTKKSLKTSILYSSGAPGAGGCIANQDGTLNVDYASPRLYICKALNWVTAITAGTGISESPAGTFIADTTYVATHGAVQKGDATFCAPAGSSATAYTCDTNPIWSPTPWANGSKIIFKPDVTSGAAATLAINGGSAIAFKRGDATAYVTGDLNSLQYYTLVYNGTNWLIQGVTTSVVFRASQNLTKVDDGSGGLALANNTNTLGTANVGANIAGAYGINLATGGTRTVTVTFPIQETFTTVTVRPSGALEVSSTGTGTTVLKIKCSCVALGAAAQTLTYSTFTTGTATTAVAGALLDFSQTITPGGSSCTKGGRLVIQMERISGTNGDTATDKIVLTDVAIEAFR